MSTISYVVKEHVAGGEYLGCDGERTPCSESAQEFDTYEEAAEACDRGVDRVYARRDGEWDRPVRGPVEE